MLLLWRPEKEVEEGRRKCERGFLKQARGNEREIRWVFYFGDNGSDVDRFGVCG